MNLYDILLAKQFGGGNGGGGNDIFVLHATIDESGDDTAVIIEESMDDIVAAVTAGKLVLMNAYYDGEDACIVLYLDGYTPADEELEAALTFYTVPFVGQNMVSQTQIAHGVDGTWAVNYADLNVE